MTRAARRLAVTASLWAVAFLLFAVSAPAGAQTHAVGHLSVTWVDPARGDRSIPVEIYYPALVPGDGVSVAPGTFPVVVFGHGYLMPWSAYQYVWEGLVPHGYVVCLPRTEGSLFPSHAQFAQDLALAVTRMQAASADGTSPFFGHIASTAAVAGHSMGGGASLLASAGSANITAVANLAAAETNPSAIAAAGAIHLPALLFAGSSDCVAPPAQHQLPMYAAMPSVCKTLVTLAGASHCQFAEENSVCSLGEAGCTPPALTRQEQHDRVLALLRPWLAAFLKDETPAFLEFQQLLSTGEGLAVQQDCTAVDAANLAGPDRPSELAVRAAPNPFRTTTRLAIEVRRAALVRVEVYDAAGRLRRRLPVASHGPGVLFLAWDGCDEAGRALGAGWYCARVRAGSTVRNVALLRLH